MGRVLAQMREKKMTQAELAPRIGIHPSTLSKYENQGRIPEDVFLRICEELEQPPDLVIEATLKLLRRDYRKVVKGKAGEPAEAAPDSREPRPSLVRLRELYDSHVAEQKKWLFAVLEYLGGELRGTPEDLTDILPPTSRRKRKSPTAKTGKGGE
jgi:transcriptional regulator with XRE-family HTH domain